MFKRMTSLFIVAVMLISVLPTAFAAEIPAMEEMIQSSSTWLSQQKNHSYLAWDIFALSQNNSCPQELAEGYYTSISAITTAEMEKKYPSDVGTMILALGAYGYDTAKVGSHNLNKLLVDKLTGIDFSDENNFIKGYDSVSKLWAPYLALKYGKITGFDRNILSFYMAKHLSSEQYYSYKDQYPSIESEAMLAVALAPLKGETLSHKGQSLSVDTVLNTAMAYYKGIQGTTGGFSGQYGESVEANSWVTHAVYATGANLDKTKLHGAVAGFYDRTAGAFKGYNGVNELSTQQALYNLIGCTMAQKGQNLFDISKTIGTKAAPTKGAHTDTPTGLVAPTGKYATVSVSNTAVQGTLIELNKEETALSLLYRLFGKENVEVDAGYVRGINCDGTWYREFDKGAKSGWKFSVDGKHINQSAQIDQLKNSTSVSWYYVTGNSNLDFEDTVKYPAITNNSFKSTLFDVKSRVNAQGLSDWDMLAKVLAGNALTQSDVKSITDIVLSKNGDFRKVTDTARYATLLARGGQDITNVGGINLAKKLQEHPNMTMQGINGPIFSLIALNSAGVKEDTLTQWSRKNLRDYILVAQNADGGFGLTAGDSSNADLTAMALCALSAYRVQHSGTIDKAITYLSTIQQPDGGYIDGGLANTESTAQVIIALSALGINPSADNRFIKNEKSPVDALLSFYVGGGQFAHSTGTPADKMASEQAALATFALGDIGKCIYFTTPHYYDDYGLIGDWATSGVIHCYQNGFMIGTGYTFKPLDTITLWQAKAVIARIHGGSVPQGTDGVTPITRGTLLTLLEQVNCGDLLLGNGTDLDLNSTVTREMLATIAKRMSEKVGN